MARLSIKRNRCAVKRMLSEYKLSRMIGLGIEAPARPQPTRKILTPVQAQAQDDGPRIACNADIFASRGNTWGALKPMEHPGDLKITAQPDGFIHVTFRYTPEDDEYVPVVRPPREPDPVRAPVPMAALRRKLHTQDLAQAHATRKRSVVCY